MRTIDFSPLYRSTVGFDRLFSLMDQLGGPEPTTQTYPPYNIEKRAENEYRISIAVAGFSEEELAIEARENTLLVRGEKAPQQDNTPREYLFQGIAGRAFERRFQLADYVNVTAAALENGLLHIDLVREIPEAKRPRTIPIALGEGSAKALKPVEAIAA